MLPYLALIQLLLKWYFFFADKQEARKAIYSNVTDSIINLVHAVEDLDIPLSTNEDKGRFEESKANVSKFWNEIQARDKKYQAVPRRNCFSVGDASDKTVINPSIASETTSSENVCSSDPICPCPVTVSALKYLWTSPCIQKAYERRNEFQLTDSAAYFLGDLDRLCVHEYEPTDDDVLRSRVQTLGIVKIEFTFRHLMVSQYLVQTSNFAIVNGQSEIHYIYNESYCNQRIFLFLVQHV